MRAQLLEFIRSLNLSGFAVSSDLPYTSSGETLYVKNVKRIYVDQDQLEVVPFVSIMSSANIDSEVTTVTVYFATDAKQTPANYMPAVYAIRNLKELFKPEYFRRECVVTTSLEADLQITELSFTLTKLTQ